MRGSLAIGMSVVAAAVVTHGMVFSAMNLNEPLPVATYQGFFQYVLLGVERMWSYAYGWQPMSHIQDFGWFYARAVHFLCPVVGFALFWMISPHKVGRKFWKPIAITFLLTLPSTFIALVPASVLAWVEVARSIVALLIMAYSVGAIHIPRPRFPKLYKAVWDSSSHACI